MNMSDSTMISPSERREIENEIRSGSWDRIRRRLCAARATGSFRAVDMNEDGRNLFHIICAENYTPLDVIQRMIEVDNAYLWAKTRGNNATALHLAAETGSASTIKYLLDSMCKKEPWNADYESGSEVWLDKDSRTPLDILWMRHLDPGYERYSGEESNVEAVADFIKELDKVTCYGDMTSEMREMWEKTNYFLAAALTGPTQPHTFADGRQWFFIHEMLRKGGQTDIRLPREVLWFALKLYPDLLKVRDDNGDLPLHVAVKKCKNWWSVSACSWYFVAEGHNGDKHLESVRDNFERTTIGILLQVCPEVAAIADKSGQLPLHIMCDTLWDERNYVSPGSIQALLEANPEALVTTNRDGNMPLHILCSSLSCCKHTFGDHSKKRFIGTPGIYDRDGNRDTIMILVESSPRAAATARDRSGRLPLHILLDNGIPAMQMYDREENEYRIVPDAVLLDTLVNMSQETLDVPDVKTGLLPFMMAATGKNSSVKCIYSMLRKNPAGVNTGIVRTTYEEYLERKIAEMASAMAEERKH